MVNICVRTPTQQSFNELMAWCDENNKSWSGRKFASDGLDNWRYYNKLTCVSMSSPSLMYGDIPFYTKRKYQIMTLEEYIESNGGVYIPSTPVSTPALWPW